MKHFMDMKLRLRNIAVNFIYLIILTVPLEISKKWFPFLLLEDNWDGSPVSIIEISRLLMIFLFLISAVYYSLRDEHGLPKKTTAPLLLLIMYIVSWTLTPAKITARNEIVRLVFLLTLAFSFVAVVKENREIEKAVHIFRWVAMILGILTVYQVATGTYFWNENLRLSFRFNATLADPNILGRYEAIGAIAWIFFPAQSTTQRILKFIGITLCLIGLFLSMSRGTWLVFAMVLFGLFFWGPAKERKRILLILIASAVFMIAVVIASAILLQRLQTLVFLFRRTSARISLILGGLAMFIDNPVFGVGLKAFPVEYITNYRQYLSYYGEALNLSHTEVITTLAEFGLIGMAVIVVFLAQVYSMYRFAIDKEGSFLSRPSNASLICLLAVILIFGCSQTEGRFWNDPYLWIFWGLLVASYRLCKRMSS